MWWQFSSATLTLSCRRINDAETLERLGTVDPLDPTPLPPGTAGVRTDGMDDPTGAGRTGV